jgi:hypothetical protein
LAEDDWIGDRQAEFNWWAYGLNAEKVGQSSLDCRVGDWPDIKDTILGLVDGISNTLERCLAIGMFD